MAAYKHYDVLLVNAMFDGMNLVAKEGPLVNERDGVSILSENTGAHEELGEFALSVNPFDIQELADSIHAALTMAPAERARRAEGPEADRHRARPGRLDRRPARGHPRKRAGRRELAAAAQPGAELRARPSCARAGGAGCGAAAERPRRGPPSGRGGVRCGAAASDDACGRRRAADVRRGSCRCRCRVGAAGAARRHRRRAAPAGSAGCLGARVRALRIAAGHARRGRSAEQRHGRRCPQRTRAARAAQLRRGCAGVHVPGQAAGAGDSPPRAIVGRRSGSVRAFFSCLRPTTSCCCSTPTRRTSAARRSSPRWPARSPRPGQIVSRPRLGHRAAWRTRSTTRTTADYHLLQFSGPASLLESPPAHAAHHRRRRALPDHQAPARHPAAAGRPARGAARRAGRRRGSGAAPRPRPRRPPRRRPRPLRPRRLRPQADAPAAEAEATAS